MKRTIFLIMLIAGICTLFAVDLLVGANKPYQTIQSAVNAAGNDDRIIIDSGTYTENVNLDTFSGGTLTIQSNNIENPNVTVVPSNSLFATFKRSSSLSVTTIYFKGLIISNGSIGIDIDDILTSTEIHVENCIIRNNTQKGVQTQSSWELTVENTELYGNHTAISSTHNWVASEVCLNVNFCKIFENTYGIVTDMDMAVDKCTIVDNTANGISLASPASSAPLCRMAGGIQSHKIDNPCRSVKPGLCDYSTGQL